MSNPTLDAFKRDAAETLRKVLAGEVIAAACGEFRIARGPLGTIGMSPAFAALVLDILAGRA